ncbi:MAG: pitrilysin family protein [Cytophagaceae bacterium]
MSEILDRTSAPVVHTIDRFHLPQVKTVSFLNGNKLHSLRMGQQPVVRIEWMVEAGSKWDAKQGASFFTAKMLTEGTSKHNAEYIQEHIAQLGAFIEVTPGTERIIITVYALDKHLPSLLPLIQDLLSDCSFPEHEWEKIQRIQLQTLEVNMKKTSYLASYKFRENLFGSNNPYGRHLDKNAIEAIQTSDLASHYSKYIVQQPLDITISGGYSDASVQLLETYFGKTKVADKPAFTTSTQKAFKTFQDTTEVEGSVQSSLRMGRHLFSPTHADYMDACIYNEILGGYFGSRLMQNIREDKGFTYGIHSSIVTLPTDGYFVIGTDVKREFTQQTIDEVNKELIRLQEDPVDAEELENVKQYMLGSFVNSIQTPFAIADKFKTLYFQGLPYKHYDDFFERVKNVQSSDIQKIATTYFNPNDLSWVVAGGF